MKKSLQIGGVILASLLTATSCQNEAIVSENQQSNYTLNVSSFVGSRTYVEQNGEVKWSEGDKLYVYGPNVSGVLTLSEGAKTKDGKFTGFVFGNPDNLQWAVFGDDVKFTADGAQFTIKEITDPNSNSPMVGAIGSGSVQMEHLCGMVRLTINNLPQNAVVTLGGTGIAGTAEVKNGKITNIASEHSISLKIVDGTDNVFEIPVFASEEETPVEFTLTIDGVSTSFNAPIKVKSLSQDAIKTFDCAVDATTGKVTGFAFSVGTEEALRNALLEGGNIALSNDITLTNKWAGTVGKFIGSLNGNGHAISGIKDSNNDGLYKVDDLIGDLSEASIKNIILEFTDSTADIYSEDGTYILNKQGNDVTLSAVYGTYTDETFSVPEGVTALTSELFASNSNIKEVIIPIGLTDFGGTINPDGKGASGGAFKGSKVEKIVLPEGLTEIPAAAFNQAAELKEINIPSTVTTIGINAFRKIALKELLIPSTVKNIGVGAFRDMPNLTTVTIEGDNVHLPTYAFRSCSKLTSVYMKVNTLTLGDSQIFTYADHNNDPAQITLYVYNDEVYNVLMAHENTKTLNIVQFNSVASTDELTNAINDGKTHLVLGEGTYVLPETAQNKTLTITGVGEPGKTVIATNASGSYEGCNYNLSGSNVVFENVTITTDNNTYTGYASCNATFNNCVINNSLTLYGDMVFNNCVFNVSGDQYNIWTWAAPTATFNGCTFNSDGKAILLYGGANTVLTVDDCIFNDTGVLPDLKAAIEIGSDYGASYNVLVNNTVVNGYEINDKGINTGSTLWGNKNSMSRDQLNVVVDDVDVY